MASQKLVDRWFSLTRERMPGLAKACEWPVSEDHCFQRILLDNAIGGRWVDEIPAPAYRNAPDAILRQAISLGEAAIAGVEDLAALNANSLAWREGR